MKLNNFIWVFIFLIISLNFIYSASKCWDGIECEEVKIDSGTIFHTNYIEEAAEKEFICKITGISLGDPNKFEIEIVQGQFEGGEKKWSVYINEAYLYFPFEVSFILSKATSPTYVLCHETVSSGGTTQNPIRIATKNYWMASFDQQWFKQNTGMPEYDGYESLKYWNENKTYNNNDRNGLNIINNEKPESEKQREDNRSATIIGALIIAIIGAVFIYNKNKIIGSLILLIISIGTLILLPTILWLSFIFIAIAIILIIDAIANNR